MWSLKLDFVFLFLIKELTFADKICLVLLKYIIYIRDRLAGLSDKPPYVRVFNKRFYYSDIYGLASLQRVYCESYRLKHLVKEDAVIIDVGANVGQFNFFCQHYLKAKRIISIEPVDNCFKVLQLNALDPKDCCRYAISKEIGTIRIYISNISSQHSTYIRNENEEYDNSLLVQTRTLDNLADELDIESCDLLKIDTEGSEYDILISAQRFLERANNVLVEMSVNRSSAGNLFAVGDFLQKRGFKLLELSSYNRRQSSVDGVFCR